MIAELLNRLLPSRRARKNRYAAFVRQAPPPPATQSRGEKLAGELTLPTPKVVAMQPRQVTQRPVQKKPRNAVMPPPVVTKTPVKLEQGRTQRTPSGTKLVHSAPVVVPLKKPVPSTYKQPPKTASKPKKKPSTNPTIDLYSRGRLGDRLK